MRWIECLPTCQCPPVVGRPSRSRSWRALLAVAVVLGCALPPGQTWARTWHVPGDAPTIGAAIDSASAGDDVLVAAREYSEYNLRMKGGLWLHSEEGPQATVINAYGRGSVIVAEEIGPPSTIEGFTILDGRAGGVGDDGYGGGIRCMRSTLQLRNCIIDRCGAHLGGGGIYGSDATLLLDHCRVQSCAEFGGYTGGGMIVWGGYLRVSDSEFFGNTASSGGGIVANWCQAEVLRTTMLANEATYGPTGGLAFMRSGFRVQDCVIAKNRSYEFSDGKGLQVIESSGTVDGCTFAENTSVPPYGSCVAVSHSSVSIRRTIIAFNVGHGIGCYSGTYSTECCDVFGNTGNDNLCGEDLGGNLSLDPLFCDALTGDYSLDAASPCLPGNHPDGVDCGLIGALDQGCGVFPTGACCFPDGACNVLTRSQCAEQAGTYQGDGSVCEPNPCGPTATQQTTWGRVRGSFR